MIQLFFHQNKNYKTVDNTAQNRKHVDYVPNGFCMNIEHIEKLSTEHIVKSTPTVKIPRLRLINFRK